MHRTMNLSPGGRRRCRTKWTLAERAAHAWHQLPATVTMQTQGRHGCLQPPAVASPSSALHDKYVCVCVCVCVCMHKHMHTHTYTHTHTHTHIHTHTHTH